METIFRSALIIKGTTNNTAALDNVVIGVTMFYASVNCGAMIAMAIKANASAPPNNPILQTTNTIGAIIHANNVE